MPFEALALTLPPLNVPPDPFAVGVGVSTTVRVAVDPSCKLGRLQVMVVEVEPPEQVPPPVIDAETNVTGTPVVVWRISSVITMLLARSGPVLVRV